MQNTKTNIEFLRDIINAEMFNKEEAIEFLDSIEEEIKELEDKNDDLEMELDSQKDRIEDLENEEWEPEHTINCGIGEIHWSTDNLQLEQLMENLQERISEYGPLKTMRMLQVALPKM